MLRLAVAIVLFWFGPVLAEPNTPDSYGTPSAIINPAEGQEEDHGSGEAAEEQEQLAAGRAEPAEEAIARYTWWLTVFTAALVGATLLLWWYTRQAANAARVAAEHIPRVERAWVFGGPIPENRRMVQPNVFEFAIAANNYGKTPAFLTEVWGKVVPLEPLSDAAEYTGGASHKVRYVMEAGAGHTLKDIKFVGGIGEYFIGYFVYSDIFKDVHTSRVCVRINPHNFTHAGSDAWNDYD